jgi:hypothetical protein
MTMLESNIHVFSEGESRPIPKPFGYPSDFGLGTAAKQLVAEYGTVGAINRLIEMAEWLEAGKNPLDWAIRKRRVQPHQP